MNHNHELERVVHLNDGVAFTCNDAFILFAVPIVPFEINVRQAFWQLVGDRQTADSRPRPDVGDGEEILPVLSNQWIALMALDQLEVRIDRNVVIVDGTKALSVDNLGVGGFAEVHGVVLSVFVFRVAANHDGNRGSILSRLERHATAVAQIVGVRDRGIVGQYEIDCDFGCAQCRQ